jgi:hypothetical protein
MLCDSYTPYIPCTCDAPQVVYDADATGSPPAQLSPLLQQQQQQSKPPASSVAAPKSSTTAALTVQGRKQHKQRPPRPSALSTVGSTVGSTAVVPVSQDSSALPHVMSFMFATGIGAVDRAARNEVELAAEIRALEQVSAVYTHVLQYVVSNG